MAPSVVIAQTAEDKSKSARPREAVSDISTRYERPSAQNDYVRREVLIPMRDGVKLFTVIIVPRLAVRLPIVLTRTPYNAKDRASRTDSRSMVATLPLADEIFSKSGYIRVYQDVRGKYGSEGDYIVTRPVEGQLDGPGVNHVTDAYDTIDWLVRAANLPEGNGRVGMIGSSYEGFTVAMALLNPHPALKVAAVESPMIDGWMGDDWFHYGAFRLANVGWLGRQTGFKGAGKSLSTGGYDDYENFLQGSVSDWAKKTGYDQLPFLQKMMAHPSYDKFWQGQALDKLLAANPSKVPTIWEQGLWDQEDMYGAITSWESLTKSGKGQNNYLVMGPWRHSHVNREGRSLGPLQWASDTTADFREKMVLPLFNQYLKDGPPTRLAPATIYNTGEDKWESFKNWPRACTAGCATKMTPVYLNTSGSLSFSPAVQGHDSYISDPAKPVPHLPRPVNFGDGRWADWLVSDQRSVDGRPDVLTYRTAQLLKPIRLSGAPIADIFARTTGTDGDFVVKLIDVFPDENPADPKMGGYQLAISLDIFRGRYRESFEHPSPIPAGKVQRYRFRLPYVNHVLLPGHRLMVQVQSSLFPIYDRNPQSYVDNIFFADEKDFTKATVTLQYGKNVSSSVWLPIVEQDQEGETDHDR